MFKIETTDQWIGPTTDYLVLNKLTNEIVGVFETEYFAEEHAKELYEIMINAAEESLIGTNEAKE